MPLHRGESEVPKAADTTDEAEPEEEPEETPTAKPASAKTPGRSARPAQTRVRAIALVLVLVVVVAALALGGASRLIDLIDPPCSGSVSINGTGSTFLAPALDEWVVNYTGARSCVSVSASYDAVGTQEGFSQFVAGHYEFYATEQPLNSTESSQLPFPAVTLPIAVGAVAVAYHVPGVSSGIDLSGAVLAEMYQGKITSWNDPAIEALNPAVQFPPLSVLPLHESGSSSTSFVFTGFLSQSSSKWASSPGQSPAPAWPAGNGVDGPEGVASAVESTPGAVGYLPDALASSDALDVAAVENAAGAFVGPSAASVDAAAQALPSSLPAGNASWASVSLLGASGASAYAISTLTYAITYRDPGYAFHGAVTQNGVLWLSNFLYWMGINPAAQSVATELAYGTLPAAVSSNVAGTIEIMTWEGHSLGFDPDGDGD